MKNSKNINFKFISSMENSSFIGLFTYVLKDLSISC
jgi:hypothetical protein